MENFLQNFLQKIEEEFKVKGKLTSIIPSGTYAKIEITLDDWIPYRDKCEQSTSLIDFIQANVPAVTNIEIMEDDFVEALMLDDTYWKQGRHLTPTYISFDLPFDFDEFEKSQLAFEKYNEYKKFIKGMLKGKISTEV